MRILRWRNLIGNENEVFKAEIIGKQITNGRQRVVGKLVLFSFAATEKGTSRQVKEGANGNGRTVFFTHFRLVAEFVFRRRRSETENVFNA